MNSAFVAKGHGYTDPSPNSGYEPCTAFDPYRIIAAPLPGHSNAERDARVFGQIEGKPGTGVCYRAFVVALAVRESDWREDLDTTIARPPDLFILMENGSGREVLRVPRFYDRGDFLRSILAMPERVQYGLLTTIWSATSNAREEARAATAQRWADAHLDGRIRKKRRAGRITLSIETPFERDLRLGKVRPSAVQIDIATGEIAPADA